MAVGVGSRRGRNRKLLNLPNAPIRAFREPPCMRQAPTDFSVRFSLVCILSLPVLYGAAGGCRVQGKEAVSGLGSDSSHLRVGFWAWNL